MMDIFQTKMSYDVSGKTGAQRPTTLPLGGGVSKDLAESSEGSGRRGAGTRKKRCRASEARVKKFSDIYETTGESLGEGSFGHVGTYRSVTTKKEYAVKVIQKTETKTRHRVLKEIEIFHHCQGHQNILQMIEYFEEEDRFYLVFEKMEGGTLLDCILKRGHLSEQEASRVVRDIASGLDFLHKKGIAHRDLKPENILCARAGQLTPVKICDFDLGSGIQIGNGHCTPVTTPELMSPVGSADFMAPEVVDVWRYQAWSYDKRCDLWSLGTILYILLCGYRPFYAHCKRKCDFDDGGDCDECQELLFKCIQQGVYSFPLADWAGISDDAKDLIQHLLVKNPYQRYTAQQVLRHPWLSKDFTATTPLATPFMLSRNNNVRELSQFAETANAVNRMIQQHLSINELTPSKTPTYSYEESAESRLDRTYVEKDPVVTPVIGSRGMFEIFQLEYDPEVDGGLGEEEEVEIRCRLDRLSDDDEVSSVSDSCGDDYIELTRSSLSALTTSAADKRARREAFKAKHLSECSVDSGNVSISSSPPDY